MTETTISIFYNLAPPKMRKENLYVHADIREAVHKVTWSRGEKSDLSGANECYYYYYFITSHFTGLFGSLPELPHMTCLKQR